MINQFYKNALSNRPFIASNVQCFREEYLPLSDSLGMSFQIMPLCKGLPPEVCQRTHSNFDDTIQVVNNGHDVLVVPILRGCTQLARGNFLEFGCTLTAACIYASSNQKQHCSLGQQVLLRCDKSHNCWIDQRCPKQDINHKCLNLLNSNGNELSRETLLQDLDESDSSTCKGFITTSALLLLLFVSSFHALPGLDKTAPNTTL
uniref:Uncharacterized protein n=1 Tax=Glossina pallidipes TaxID=7398 RepID=A0A1A9Z5C7_GLOPL